VVALVAAAALLVPLPGLRSPSGNITCFELTARGSGRPTCSGGILYNPDTERPRYVTLAYGASRRLGVFTCTSRVTGVTCTSPAGHGLFVSRESWHAS
jgi:hypothetical protein